MLTTVSVFYLETWKFAANFVNKGATEVVLDGWIISVILRLIFFWLDKLRRRLWWLPWLNKHGAFSVLLAAVIHLHGRLRRT
ncbi:uncharacterized protein PHACADRAFT_210666 [Phanerochaete carnosa HHB-10118-sp]|uniref:Uncharacterized protein n=1 Tax=Phanerochaete carnosa (strain HHB-10118-sp) TaxID=650164 RepID=K5WWR9_PHACS|nr:uncharacterized protein PHACADRAFT_210666 [Phanerochaete carnosa HHB-10118-sp]EKM54897.1 hypothetical protein PHACADRAFT_210666 [Phanerochaete carnosa HHB-10118-sp]